MKSFFRTYRDHAWRLTLFNAAYFVLVSPLLLILYICLNAYSGILVGDSSVADVLPGLGFYMSVFSFETALGRALTITAVALSALLFGPVKFLMLRMEIGFCSDQYRFFADDLALLRKRLPQTLVFGIVDLLVLGRTITNLCGVFDFGWQQTILLLLRIFSLIVLVFWIAFRRWMYLLSASCDLRIRQILKNGFLLTAACFGKNAQCSAACVLIWAITFLTLPIVSVVLLPLCAYSASSLTAVCSLYPIIQSKVLKEN